MVKTYVNIKLPEELAKEIDRLIEKRILGYRSRGEFVAEATRTLLMKIKTLEIDKPQKGKEKNESTYPSP